MKICVYGLTHLGLVTSACLAKKGFNIVGLDTDNVIDKLVNHNNIGNFELESLISIPEPKLKELIEEGKSNDSLRFTDNINFALDKANVLWVCYDTPIDKKGNANVDYVIDKIRDIFCYINVNTLVIISSQLIVGTTRFLQKWYKEMYPNKNVTFVYSPENLRRGRAIDGFNNPDRVIVGMRNKDDSILVVDRLLMDLGYDNTRTYYMSFESAEMVKHSLNTFLAMEISFANEIGSICKKVGVDYKDVEFGLKSDSRIGENSYLRAGDGYSDTHGRDVKYITELSKELNVRVPIISSINLSNNLHKKLENKK